MKPIRIIEKNRRFILHLVENDQGQEILLKTLSEDHPSLDSQAQLQNELMVTEKLNHRGLRAVLGESFYDDRKCILLEYIEGENLGKRIPIDLGSFFRFALEITDTLRYLHNENVFHRDISVHNIMYNTQSNRYQLIDFGTAINLEESFRNDYLIGTPAYTSPELTGRLQITPDHRADIYSLGAVFYEVLTGVNPFRENSDMQTIYKQIAWLPEIPEQINPAIPVTLSRIIMKMLAKDPDKRYLSVEGILYDLEEARLLFRRNVIPEDFEPGSSEKPPPYNDTPEMVGYQSEMALLYKQFSGLQSGTCQLTWLKGPEGVGKSTLINSMLGKFYEQQVMYLNISTGSGNTKPYALLFELFEQILKRIDEEPEEQILKRKVRFSAENISDVGFLVEKIPSLSRFVSVSSFGQDHGSIHSQNRFQLALRDLLRVLSMPERPIIAHFTRSDHIDQESTNFLKRFVNDIKDEFIWIIFEHSNYEETESGELIQLDGLNPAEMDLLFKKMIGGEIKSEENTHEFLKNYAGRLPGKLIQLVRYWYKNKFLLFDHKRKYWYWNNTDNKSVYPDAFVMHTQITDPVERDLLQWASLIEGNFTVELINSLSSFDFKSIQAAFQSLNIKNLIISSDQGKGKESYKLSAQIDPSSFNDESQIPLADKHVAIFTELQNNNADIYHLAYHVNKSIENGAKTFQGRHALEINAKAGLKAKEEGAFMLSRKYFSTATEQLSFIQEPERKTNYIIYLNLAELTALEGAHHESEQLFEKAFTNSTTELEEAGVYSSQMILYNHLGNHDMAFNLGRKALQTIGFPIPSKANPFTLIAKLFTLWIKLHRKDPMKLLELAPIQDPKVILSFRIMENLHTSIFNKSSSLLLIVLLISMQRILKYGNAPEGYSAYAGFGAVLALGFKNYKKGWAFTLAGTEMTMRFNNKFYKGRGVYAKGAWIINYIKHTRESIPILEEGIQLSKESGDFSYATTGYLNLLEAYFMIGSPFDKMEKVADEVTTFTYQIGFDDILAFSLVTKRYILRMTQRLNEFGQNINKWFNGRDLDKYTEQSDFKHIRIYSLLLDAYWHYFDGQIEQGLQDLLLAKPLLYTLQGPAIIIDYYVILGLLNYENYKLSNDKKSLRIFKKSTSKLKKFARLVPENYQHRYLLLQALNLERKGKYFAARNLMRDALSIARQNEFLQIEGICSLYLSKWFLKIDRKDYARLHFRESMNVFSKMGSTYITEKLSHEFAAFISTDASSTKSLSGSERSSGHSGFSNPEVLMQSALSVAAETDFESLLDVMNQLFIQQAGATRSLLFINASNELRLLYAMDNNEKSFYPYPGQSLMNGEEIPLSILRLVQRTHEPVVIHDTLAEMRFRFEPYLRDTNPFSILVTPLIYRGELSGIIYFENRLLTNAFSEKRQELLRLLSGQFAVSLQNARLVEELEHRVKERTLALESEKDRADHLLRNILPVETAEELKIKGKATPKYHKQVTVMFTDFIGFTRTSEKMHPEALVKMLDYYFRGFDRIIHKYGLEKIKTIGDAYLCVAGLPIYQPRHAMHAVKAAFEILDFVNNAASSQEYGLEIRIGIHSGPVVAGVVGEEKFAYDIWGDTVNTASRMETNSQSGKINISKETMDHLMNTNLYKFSYRGKVKAKNKGEIDMYFVEEKKEALADHENAISMILHKMKNELSEELKYHSIQHTREIMESVKRIGEAEGLTIEELDLLNTAAAFHDSGFIYTTDEHEAKSASLAAEYLPEYGFSKDQIDHIKQMILATRIPQKPKDLLSKVLCDADLYYLGTDQFFEIGDKLYEEFKIQGIVNNRKEWIALQIRFLESHQYHTQTAIRDCEAQKQVHLAQLRKMLDKVKE